MFTGWKIRFNFAHYFRLIVTTLSSTKNESVVCATVFFLFVQVLVADEVSQNIKTWTSKAGTKIKASLISAKHHEVKLKTKEGKILSLHPHKLSEEDQEFVFTEFPLTKIAQSIIGKRIIIDDQGSTVTVVFQFNEDGGFEFGTEESGKIIKEQEGLIYKIKGLEVEIFKGQEKTNRLKFYNSLTKIGDTLSFGLSRTMVNGKIISLEPAKPF